MAKTLSPDAGHLLRLLERYYDDRPVTAAYAAEAIGVAPNGNREWRRRRVRGRAEELRGAGYEVCAGNDGYWLARSGSAYAEYLDAVRRNAVFRFVAARKMAVAVSEKATGQQRLF